MFFRVCLPPWEGKLDEGRDQSCSLVNLQFLNNACTQRLFSGRRNEGMNDHAMSEEQWEDWPVAKRCLPSLVWDTLTDQPRGSQVDLMRFKTQRQVESTEEGVRELPSAKVDPA